ncbi:uncharacterized protein LOC101856202 [Aplysia californica]|uniref:Uncharacterized protein LOC101856202 n=1 Tax=Aplysia californica TaxID=6500 RepID=A0ABM0JYN3_APLCA|nr:uncharacterized protein LOC101856202 [Aplysia californica]
MAQIFGIDHKYVAVSTAALSIGVAAYSMYKYRSMVAAVKNVVPGSEVYESEKLLGEYLVFHFGSPEQLIPYPFGPKDALDFPKRCAELCLKHYKPQEGLPDRALDIGCAVGRSSFDLSRGVKEVIGIDYSQSFIDAANTLKQNGEMSYQLVQEGDVFTQAVAKVEKDVDRSRVSFEQGDACDLRSSLGQFGVILAANLVCRLHHPKEFLKRLTSLLPNRGGILVITAPYTWLRDFANKNEWLGGYVGADGQAVTGFQGLQKELGPYFDLVEEVNMPFFIRETARKNQWTVAHATVWRRK